MHFLLNIQMKEPHLDGIMTFGGGDLEPILEQPLLFFFEYCIYLFIWLRWVLVVAHGVLCCGMQPLSCDMWIQFPEQGLNPGPLH